VSPIDRALALLGLAAVVTGCYLYSPPLAFVVGGILLIADVAVDRLRDAGGRRR